MLLKAKYAFAKCVVYFLFVSLVLCIPLAAAGWTSYASLPHHPFILEKSNNHHPDVASFFVSQKRKIAETSVADVSNWGGLGARDYPSQNFVELENVAYMGTAKEAFALSEKMVSQMSTHGFGVQPYSGEPSPYSAGFSTIYYEIYEADLPVFVTVDSVLHAFHRSFDDLMQYAEEQYLFPRMHWLMAGMLERLNPKLPAERDAMLYLAVPFKLLDNENVFIDYEKPSFELPNDVDREADGLLQLIFGESVAQFNFFGQSSELDFSVFYPRGHYGESFELSQLFRAMIWLNRLPLLAYSQNSVDGSERHQRMVRAVLKAMRRPVEKKRYASIHRFYSELIGNDNAVDMLTVLKRCRQQEAGDCMHSAKSFIRVLQRLAKDVSMQGEAANADVRHLKFFPTKFEYTAWLTEQTSQPRLNPERIEGGRTIPSPLDVAYVLGSDRAAFWLKRELDANLPDADRVHLVAALQAARRTIDAMPPSKIANTPLSDWLEALMHASAPMVEQKVPKVMKSALWHDHKLETVLASWTEMRHDTLLMVNGGGASGCDFPLAYVEPIPAAYKSLNHAIKKMQRIYFSLHPEMKKKSLTFFAHFRRVMQRLEQMSRNALRGKEMTASELKYINGMMAMETDDYTGERLYDGWYPRLYWTPWEYGERYSEHSGTDEPLVADVFSDVTTRRVLETATGHPGILFSVLNIDGKEALYVGAVSSFYYFVQDAEDRMNDEDWRMRLAEDPPERPGFVRSYWVE